MKKNSPNVYMTMHFVTDTLPSKLCVIHTDKKT